MTDSEPQESGDNYRVEAGRGSRVGSAFMVSVDTDREDRTESHVPGERNGNRE